MFFGKSPAARAVLVVGLVLCRCAAADVAFIPVWFFQTGPGEAVVEAFLDAPLKIAVQVPLDEVAEARAFLAERFPGVKLLDPLEEIRLESTWP